MNTSNSKLREKSQNCQNDQIYVQYPYYAIYYTEKCYCVAILTQTNANGLKTMSLITIMFASELESPRI